MDIRCPTCKKPSAPRGENKAFPFCCERCRLIDLGGWLDESYRVPVDADASDRDGLNEEQASRNPRSSDDLPN